jgi:hypothetical protein
VPGELAAGAGAVASHQHRPVGGGELGQGEVDQFDKVAGRAGRGVARPQDAGQWLTRSGATVQVGQQWGEPEGVLVGACRAFLVVALGSYQGRVGVDDQQVDVRVAAGGPGAGAGMGPGGPQPGQPILVTGRAFDDPPGSRGRGHRPEQLRLVP